MKNLGTWNLAHFTLLRPGEKISCASTCVEATYFAWNPTNTQIDTCIKCTEDKERSRQIVVNFSSWNLQYHNIALAMKTAQVSDKRTYFAICKTLADFNELYLNDITAVFMYIQWNYWMIFHKAPFWKSGASFLSRALTHASVNRHHRQKMCCSHKLQNI
jgi:hypothetical protein